jgi:hypothetical protein
MFAKLNNRIIRTLAATLIPAAMTLGLAGNTFADTTWTAPRTNDAAATLQLDYFQRYCQ